METYNPPQVYEIVWDNIRTMEDLKSIVKAMSFHFIVTPDMPQEHRDTLLSLANNGLINLKS